MHQYHQQNYSGGGNANYGSGFDYDMGLPDTQNAPFNSMQDQRKVSNEYQNYGSQGFNGGPQYNHYSGSQNTSHMNQYKSENQFNSGQMEHQNQNQAFQSSSIQNSSQPYQQTHSQQNFPNQFQNQQNSTSPNKNPQQNFNSSSNERVDSSSLLHKSPQQPSQNKFPNQGNQQMNTQGSSSNQSQQQSSSQNQQQQKGPNFGQPASSMSNVSSSGPGAISRPGVPSNSTNMGSQSNQMQSIVKNFFETIKKGDIDQVMNERQKYNIDVKNIYDEQQYKQTPIFAATLIKDEDTALKMVEILVQAGLNAAATDSLQQTALYYASKDGKNRLIEYLVKHGCNINQIDTYGQTPIFYPAREGRVETLKKMQELGADLDVVDNNGQTPLYYSIKQGKFDACEFLIKSGANVNNEDKKGVKPVNHARKLQKQSIVELLVQHGAQPLNEAKQAKVQQKKQPQPPKQRVNERKIPRKFQLTVLKDGGYVPLSEEEYNQFKQQYPDLARYFEEERAIDGLNIPEVNENAPIYENWDKAAKRLLQVLMKMQSAYIFLEPVDPVKLNIPDYPTIIKNPMDFGTIKSNLQSNKYQKMDDFVKDIHLVFDNCFLYNGENSYVSGLCKQVKEEFQRQFESLSMEFYM